MKQPHIREEKIAVTSTPGPKTVMVPAGAYYLEAQDTDGGTLSVKRGLNAAFASGQSSFERQLPVVGQVQRVFPQTFIEFSSGSGVVYAESDDSSFGTIWVSEDNINLNAALTVAK